MIQAFQNLLREPDDTARSSSLAGDFITITVTMPRALTGSPALFQALPTDSCIKLLIRTSLQGLP